MTTSLTRSSRLGTTAVLMLCAIPVLGAVVRVTELATGAEITPDNARFFVSPVPVLLHVVGSAVYLVLGAFQFVPRLRRGRWHRTAGRILVPAGLVAALSALWLTLFFPVPARDEGLLEVFRLLAGSAMTIFLVLGLLAILRRDVGTHRAWMIRAYAIGLGAGTQAVILIPVGLVLGPPTGLAWPLLMGSAWVINLAVAEAIVRHSTKEHR